MVDVPELLLRQAEATDARRLREWRNDPATRAASRNTAPVDAGAHEAWFASVIANPDRHLLVADEDRTPVGSLRFDRRAELCYEISVVVAPEARGRGLGTALIRAGLGWLREHHPARWSSPRCDRRIAPRSPLSAVLAFAATAGPQVRVYSA